MSRSLIHRAISPDPRISILTFRSFSNSEVFPWGTRIAEHRLNPAFLDELESSFKQVTSDENCRAVVLHNEGRFWCNGFDLRWMDRNLAQADAFQRRTEKLLGELLTAPVVTLASIDGHATAAGAMLALACDYRVMSYNPKGTGPSFFIPAVELGLVYSRGMTALMRAKLTPSGQRDVMLMGKRYDGATLESELDIGVKCLSGDPAENAAGSSVDNLQGAIDCLQREILIRDRPGQALSAVKRGLYADAYKQLTNPKQFVSMGWNARGTIGRDRPAKL